MSHTLLKVVYSDHIVSITHFDAILRVHFCNELNVFDVAVLTPFLISNRIVKRGYETVSLKEPSEISKCQRLVESAFRAPIF